MESYFTSYNRKGKKVIPPDATPAPSGGAPKTGTLAERNNNPGNLRFANQTSAVQGDSGFAKFPTIEAGWNALKNQISLDATRELTLQDFVSKYAPPNENDTKGYLNHMVSILNTDATANLKTIVDTVGLDKVAEAIALKEDVNYYNNFVKPVVRKS